MFLHTHEQRFGARQLLWCLCAEKTLRIQRQNQLAAVGETARAVIPRQRFGAGHIADKRPGQQLNHCRQRRALMAAESQHRAVQHLCGIGRWLSLTVDSPAFR